MAGAVEKIGREDIEKFIIQHMYGENGWDWPRATIVLSTVEIHYTTIVNDTLPIKAVYKNESKHAEELFLAGLKNEIDRLLKNGKTAVTKIQAKLVQNYTPCTNCADKILQFKAAVEQQGITFSLTIKFANFYRHREPPNLDGLRRLKDSGVTLDLLEGENKWTEFLHDEDFVRLTEEKKRRLLNRATSTFRRNNEQRGTEIFNENELGNISQPSGK